MNLLNSDPFCRPVNIGCKYKLRSVFTGKNEKHDTSTAQPMLRQHTVDTNTHQLCCLRESERSTGHPLPCSFSHQSIAQIPHTAGPAGAPHTMHDEEGEFQHPSWAERRVRHPMSRQPLRSAYLWGLMADLCHESEAFEGTADETPFLPPLSAVFKHTATVKARTLAVLRLYRTCMCAAPKLAGENVFAASPLSEPFPLPVLRPGPEKIDPLPYGYFKMDDRCRAGRHAGMESHFRCLLRTCEVSSSSLNLSSLLCGGSIRLQGAGSYGERQSRAG